MKLSNLRKEVMAVPLDVVFTLHALRDVIWQRELERSLRDPSEAAAFSCLVHLQRWLRWGAGTQRSADSGVCPQCGDHDGLIVCHGGYWAICHLHRARWFAGFLSHRERSLDRAFTKMDARIFAAYREIDSLHRDQVEHFGVCPVCFSSDGYLNVGRTHWFVCHEHGLRWCAGANLFSSWRRETQADWDANWDRIRRYREVEPTQPEAPADQC
jgi:hypothetical protein